MLSGQIGILAAIVIYLAAMGFLPARLCFLTVSAVNAQTY